MSHRSDAILSVSGSWIPRDVQLVGRVQDRAGRGLAPALLELRQALAGDDHRDAAAAGVGQQRRHRQPGQIFATSSSMSSSGGSSRSPRIAAAIWQAVQWISLTRQANTGATGEVSPRGSAIRYSAPCRHRNSSMPNPSPGPGSTHSAIVGSSMNFSAGVQHHPDRRPGLVGRRRASAPGCSPTCRARAPAGSAPPPGCRRDRSTGGRRAGPARPARPRRTAPASASRPARTRSCRPRCPWSAPRRSARSRAASPPSGPGSPGSGPTGSWTGSAPRRCAAGRTYRPAGPSGPAGRWSAGTGPAWSSRRPRRRGSG